MEETKNGDGKIGKYLEKGNIKSAAEKDIGKGKEGAIFEGILVVSQGEEREDNIYNV